MKIDLTTEAGRAKLPVRPAPYYVQVGEGQFIGLRRSDMGGGDIWVGRVRVNSEQKYPKLGRLDGEPATHYPRALAAAFEAFEQLGGKAAQGHSIGTVADVCLKYIAYLNATKAKSAKAIRRMENNMRNAIEESIGAIDAEKLTTLDVTKWRGALLAGQRQRKDGRIGHTATLGALSSSAVNRQKKDVFAALNWAADSGYLLNRSWATKKNLPETIGREGVFIPEADGAQLVAAAEGKVRDYLVCIMLTGARPVEFQRALREHLDLSGQVARIRLLTFKGRGSKPRWRTCGIPAEARAAFERFAASKLPKAPLFTREDGQPFAEAQMSKEFGALVKRVFGDDRYRLYDTRHTRIASLLMEGVDVQTVAKSTGTSLQMIDRHYSKFMPDDAAHKVAAIGF